MENNKLNEDVRKSDLLEIKTTTRIRQYYLMFREKHKDFQTEETQKDLDEFNSKKWVAVDDILEFISKYTDSIKDDVLKDPMEYNSVWEMEKAIRKKLLVNK